ncbi:MAG: alkaline phytoceramidase [Acidobacteria bacterium]|nr:alkaline phytoceramidase [Acidobacteriota bacterium]
MERAQRGLTIGIGAAVLIALVFAMVPPVMQDPAYHAFADRRTLWGVPNFWNVITNAGFLLVALYGLKSLRSSSAFIASWERTAYAVLLAGSAAVSAGSSYYHLHPDDSTLFWDRLPMAVIFMALLAAILGERLGTEVGRGLLLPLLVFGAGSVFYWRFTGDLRLYGVVQFGTMLALPLILLAGPPRYTLTGGLWWTAALYAAAKIAEFLDRPIAGSIATGGHPWKHLLAAGALFAYVRTVSRRRRMDRAESSYGES